MSQLFQTLRLLKRFRTNPVHIQAQQKSAIEMKKRPLRYEVINFLIARKNADAKLYLEIGVCNPENNFNKVVGAQKYGVDPGVEFKENPVDFKMTSNAFFDQLKQNKILSSGIRFDVIFIDGLHLSVQVEQDIQNSLEFLKDDGFLVMHDCNPPTEYHAREDRTYVLSPAMGDWNGTTWKAFYKNRLDPALSCCCIDSDWGIGIISKTKYFAPLQSDVNPFFEFAVLDEHRKEALNLIDFETFQKVIESHKVS